MTLIKRFINFKEFNEWLSKNENKINLIDIKINDMLDPDNDPDTYKTSFFTVYYVIYNEIKGE